MVDICLPSPRSWGKDNEKQPMYNPTTNGQEQPPSGGGSKYNVDSMGSGTSTKSCFSLFSKKQNLDSVYSRNSSSQSSSHQRPKLSTAVQQDDFAQTWEAFNKNNSHNFDGGHEAASTGAGSDPWNIGQPAQPQQQKDDPFAMLQMPKPTDRSHKRRLKLEKEKRQAGVYDGELEPEGERGQEAMVLAGGSAQTTTPMRSFGAGGNEAPPPLPIAPLHVRPLETINESSESLPSSNGSGNWAQTPGKGQAQAQQPVPLMTTVKNNNRAANPQSVRRRPRTVSPGNTPGTGSPSRSVDPPAYNSYDSSSTSSDEDISQMMSDFLNSSKMNTSFNTSLMERDYPNPIRMPRSEYEPPIVQVHQPIPRNANVPPVLQQPPPQKQETRLIPITVSESSSQTSQSPYRSQQRSVNFVSPDPSASPNRRGIHPHSTASFSSEEELQLAMARQFSQGQHILPPPQNQHSPQRSQASGTTISRASTSRSQQPDPPVSSATVPSRMQASSSPTRSPMRPSSQSPTFLQPADPENIDSWNTLALQHVHNGEYDMALAAFQHVLRAYKQQYGNVHPLVASAYHNLGTVHAKRAQMLLDDTLHQRHCRAQSLQCFQSAARAARDSLGRDHPNVAVSLVRIGFLLLQARQYNNAVITFQEALRIRQAHYGPHHALVANLYNNLGVCYMHLGQFAHGRDLLQHALQIQRTLLQQAQEEAERSEEKKDGSMPAATSQALELADTLFNIGGLALEWIRRQGPDVRHAEDAEAAFEEALELRKSVLGPKDPMVLQVKSLLDMARSIPRPKSSAGKPYGGVNPIGNVNFKPPTQTPTAAMSMSNPSSSRAPDPIGESPYTTSSNLSPSRANLQGDLASSPYRYYGKSGDTDSSSPARASPSRPPKNPQQQSSSSPVRYYSKADYLEPPRVSRRSPLDQADGGPPGKPQHPMSPTNVSDAGRMSIASSAVSAASTVKVGSPARLSSQARSSSPTQNQQQSVFRPEKEERSLKSGSKLPPPVLEIAVSQDEEDDGLYDPAALPRPANTNIFISPHYVPHLSPHKVNYINSNESRSEASTTFSEMPISLPTSSVAAGAAIQKTYSYDPEEQLILTDGLGGAAANNPLPDDYDAMPFQNETESTRKIMVMRPYRSTPDDSITSPTSVMSSRPWAELPTRGEDASNLYSSDLDYSSKTASYKNARSETLDRARALLQTHNNPNANYMDSPQLQLAGQPPFLNNSYSPDRVKQQLFKQDKGLGEDVEDGLAPLGSLHDSVVASSSADKKIFHPDMITNNPDEHMREIYEEASRCLKNHYYDEAKLYFKTILNCQLHLHGPVHHDVAAALHNCGLAQLRAGSHHEALKSFEEAVRIRKGTLGKEHPHVAHSLVKSGITFLLLHRFEEALWSFREALSIRKHSLGTLHPSTARIYNNIGCVHMEFNELREARRAFEGALDIQRNALCQDPESGPVRFGAAATLCNLGYLYRYRGMHERAAQVLREAADIQEAILGGTHPTVLSTMDSLAEALASSGKASEAYVTHETIFDRFKATETAGTRRLVRAEAGLKYKMSKSAKQMGDPRRQINCLQQALQAVRSLDEETEAARNHASALEKRILSDLRDARNGEATNELKWV